jgi:two-component system LytT family response regulator
MIKAIAIDDEPLALEVIRSHAAKVPFCSWTNVLQTLLKRLNI